MEFTLQPQQQQYSTKSLISIGVTVLLHLIIGYALITGLARDVISVITKPIETRIIEEVKPPPPPEVKAEPPKLRIKPPPAYVPPPEVRVATPPSENVIAAVSSTPAPIAPPAPDVAPAPPVAKVGLACPDSTRIRQSLEYPRQALKDNVTGSVLVQFVVGSNGQSRDFSLIRAAHPLLNRAALDAAQRFTCVGQGRDVVVQVPFDFKLE